MSELSTLFVHEGGETRFSEMDMLFHGLGLLGLEGKEGALTFKETGSVVVGDLQVVVGKLILDSELVGIEIFRVRGRVGVQ